MPKRDITDLELEFLRQSNLIEREPAEGAALDDAIRAWLSVRDRDIMRPADILRCHKLLMRTRITIASGAKGQWAKVQTEIWGGGKRIRVNPHPREIPRLVSAWTADITENVSHHLSGRCEHGEGSKDRDTRDYHVSFENVHPFQDGNGRVGRILMNWHRLRIGLPVLVIREDRKSEYYAWFRN